MTLSEYISNIIALSALATSVYTFYYSKSKTKKEQIRSEIREIASLIRSMRFDDDRDIKNIKLDEIRDTLNSSPIKELPNTQEYILEEIDDYATVMATTDKKDIFKSRQNQARETLFKLLHQ